MIRPRPLLLAAAGLAVAVPMLAQQLPDTSYHPAIAVPSFPRGRGPTVCVDGGHRNFHMLDGGFLAFGRLLELDGWQPRATTAPFDPAALAPCRVLVAANARPPGVGPDAFTTAEVAAVRAWVAGGGSLLLIADHMPFGGAARSLADAFGVAFTDGFAVSSFNGLADLDRALGAPTFFRRSDGTLAEHPVTTGVDSVRTFMGQAFRIPAGATPILFFPGGFQNLYPGVPWAFSDSTRREDVGGWTQGIVLPYGRGRVAIFGEAAMFTAQLSGPERLPGGMNAPGAEQNFLLVSGLLRWLGGT